MSDASSSSSSSQKFDSTLSLSDDDAVEHPLYGTGYFNIPDSPENELHTQEPLHNADDSDEACEYDTKIFACQQQIKGIKQMIHVGALHSMLEKGMFPTTSSLLPLPCAENLALYTQILALLKEKSKLLKHCKTHHVKI